MLLCFFKQVIIDGIGIFSICLGKDFSSCEFLHSSLYLLLENLICSNFQIRSASDAVLHVIAATCGYSTVSIHGTIMSQYLLISMISDLLFAGRALSFGKLRLCH